MKGRALPIIRAVMPHGLPANYVPHLKLKVKYLFLLEEREGLAGEC